MLPESSVPHVRRFIIGRTIATRDRRSVFRFVLYLVLTVCLIVIAGGTTLVLEEGRIVFIPDRTLHTSPAAHGLSYQSVSFRTSDGVLLNGWYLPSAHPRAIVLVCHGNAGNISTRIPLLEALHSMELSVFIFDYRGYGKSDGRPSESGTYLDAGAAWNWVDENVVAQSLLPVIIMGRSLGGPIAARLADEHPPDALVLDSTFPSLIALVRSREPLLPARLLLRFRYNTLQPLAHADYPILVVHSHDDRVVPFSVGETLYRELTGSKSFLELTGPHVAGFAVDRTAYVEGLSRFLERFGVLSRGNAAG